VSEVTVTPKEFLEDLVARINDKSEKFSGMNIVLGYDFRASNDGEWYITIEDGEVAGPFEGENHEATITTIGPLAVVVEESKKKFNPMTAMWNTGALRFHGDAMALTRFNKALEA
jgi:hypothetical protein